MRRKLQEARRNCWTDCAGHDVHCCGSGRVPRVRRTRCALWCTAGAFRCFRPAAAAASCRTTIHTRSSPIFPSVFPPGSTERSRAPTSCSCSAASSRTTAARAGGCICAPTNSCGSTRRLRCWQPSCHRAVRLVRAHRGFHRGVATERTRRNWMDAKRNREAAGPLDPRATGRPRTRTGDHCAPTFLIRVRLFDAMAGAFRA